MKSVFDIYKKIIIESSYDINDEFDEHEGCVELSKYEVEKMFNAEFDADYENGQIKILDEIYSPAEILQDMRPEDYARLFNNYCKSNDIEKIDNKYYSKIILENKVINEEEIPTEENEYCGFNIDIVPNDIGFNYNLSLTKTKKDSGFIDAFKSTGVGYKSQNEALKASKDYIKKINIQHELKERTNRLKNNK